MLLVPRFPARRHSAPLQVQKSERCIAQLDAAREQLLDDEDCVLRGKAEAVKEAERRLKHKLLPRNAWRLIEYFELFMSCPKDELHQWYVVYIWYILIINMVC